MSLADYLYRDCKDTCLDRKYNKYLFIKERTSTTTIGQP